MNPFPVLSLSSLVLVASLAGQGPGAKPAAPRWLHPGAVHAGKAIARPLVRAPLPAQPDRGGLALAVATETEPNDTNSRPDPMAGATDFDGTLATPGDVDYVSFELAQDALVSLAVHPRGATPAPDPLMFLDDATGGFITMNDDTFGLYPWLGVPLAAGSYRVLIGTFDPAGAGDYRLSLAVQSATIPALLPNQVANGACNAATGGIETYKFVLPVASAVTITATSATLDANLAIARPSGGEITWDNDSVSGPDPRIDTHLRAGTYYLRVADAFYRSGAFSLLLTATPGEPVLGCSGVVGGNLVGDEAQPIWKVTLAAPTDVIWRTSAGTVPTVRDTILRVFDADYGSILYNDDSLPSGYSRTGGTLPAGTYYVMVQPFPSDSGNFSLSMTCANPTAVAGQFGQNALSMPASGLGVTLTVDLGTPSPLDLVITPLGTDMGLFTILDDTGRMRGTGTMLLPPDTFGGAPLPSGRFHLLVHEFNNQAVPLDVSVRPQIWFRNRVTDRTLLVADEAGRQLHLFASAALLPAPVPLFPPLQGNLLIDLGLHVYLGVQTMPVTGTLVWPVAFQPYPVALQAMSVQPAPFAAAMTQAVR